MLPVGFKLVIPGSERLQTHALDRLATVKGKGKSHPTTDHEGPKGSRCVALLRL